MLNCPTITSLLPTETIPVRHRLRRLLWKVGFAASIVLAAVIYCDVNARLQSPSTKLSLGHDLIPSYAAGVVVRQGHPRDMYDRHALEVVERQMMVEGNLDIDPRYGAWLNPPFYAWIFAPLSSLPYRTAAAVFLAINIALFSAAVVMAARLIAHPTVCNAAAESTPVLDWRTYGLVPLLIVLPFPVWQAMGHQQNTFISLLLLVSTVTCWRMNRPFTAGAVLGLLFFKPQLAAVLAIVMIIAMGWRALAGLAATGSALLAITLITLPGCLSDYLHRLPPILHWMQMELPYNWGRQVTLQSFWRLLIQGHVRGETVLAAKLLWWATSGAILVAMAVAIRNYWRGRQDPISRDRLIAAAIAAMPLLMPYYMDYDLLLLAIPATLLAAEWIRHPAGITQADYWLLAAWAIFGVETHFNPSIAGGSRWNLVVPLIAVIGVLHIARCMRREPIDN